MADIDSRVRNAIIFAATRWIVMLALILYGIFADRSWAIAAGAAIAAIGLISSSTALARNKKSPSKEIERDGNKYVG